MLSHCPIMKNSQTKKLRPKNVFFFKQLVLLHVVSNNLIIISIKLRFCYTHQPSWPVSVFHFISSFFYFQIILFRRHSLKYEKRLKCLRECPNAIDSLNVPSQYVQIQYKSTGSNSIAHKTNLSTGSIIDRQTNNKITH